MHAAAGGAKLAGSISPANDVDAMSVLLSRDDVLKAKLATKVKNFDLALDLVRPDGTRIALDRYPADAKKPMISGFVAPETGEYLIVLRRAAPGQTTTGDYSLTVSITAVPEPGLLSQLASALLALVVLDKRRRCANG